MAILSDYHLHSSFSGDSKTPMEDMIKKGISLGMEHLCFTEHMDMDYVYLYPEETDRYLLDIDAYSKKFLQYRDAYASRISLHFGVELGIQPHLTDALNDYTESYDFDFIIASSHICNRKDPYYPPFYEGRTEQEAYLEYFTSILPNLKAFDNFDVYGHLDYVVRYGPNKDKFYHYNDYRNVLDEILKLLIAGGKGIEVNTGGISYGLRELNPCTDVLKRYRELGGEIITFGSDAHAPDRLLHGNERAASILKDCGFTHYTIFSKRKPIFLPLS